VEESGRTGGQRTFTPAVIASALFAVACAAIAITFVAARGGLELPIAAASSHAAVMSPVPSAAPSAIAPTPVATPIGPVASQPAPPSATAPSPVATAAPTPAGSPDPLEALPGCPGIAGCFEYEIQHGDTLSGVASRYVIPTSIVLALNPEVTDPSTIVVGQTLYLGRDPFLRLPPCPDQPDCSLYEVRPGDRLSTIAGRFGLTLEAVLAANPEITDANAIRSGQLIRLLHPVA
jgi:hypothetical protein